MLPGHYLYLEADDFSITNPVARLISPQFDLLDKTACLSFRYHMAGLEQGVLSVFAKQITGLTSAMFFRQYYDVSSEWLTANIDLTNFVGRFTIQVKKGSGVESDTAIDDITILEANCPEFSKLIF